MVWSEPPECIRYIAIYILSCRASAIYGLPIKLRYIYKRVSPLVGGSDIVFHFFEMFLTYNFFFEGVDEWFCQKWNCSPNFRFTFRTFPPNFLSVLFVQEILSPVWQGVQANSLIGGKVDQMVRNKSVPRPHISLKTSTPRIRAKFFSIFKII